MERVQAAFAWALALLDPVMCDWGGLGAWSACETPAGWGCASLAEGTSEKGCSQCPSQLPQHLLIQLSS